MALLDLAGLVVLGLIIWGIVWVVNRHDNNRLNAKKLRKQLTKAESALRHIANGSSGDSALEASIALDEIEQFYETKELN